MRILSFLYVRFGRRLSHALLLPIAAYFFLTSPRARRASRRYLAAVEPLTTGAAARDAKPTARNVSRHLFQFATANLDILAAWHDPERIPVRFPQSDVFFAAARRRQGMLLISAHFGNPEVSRALLRLAPELRINALVYTERAPKSNALFDEISDAYAIRLIPVQTIGPQTAMLLHEKIAAGEVVVIVGDRTPVAAGSPTVEADFLGRPAAFAAGPYILAHALECPVYLFFCVAEDGGYTAYLEPFAERVHLPRGARDAALRELAARYAARLADYAARFPLQWYNFYDFWAPPRRSQ
ncbi:MAG TPA: hypothetical protein VFX38_01640 [Gammaproteobacteria bacterium]|nr:hypothetical protein [Gammaproteobacteria bacterium]